MSEGETKLILSVSCKTSEVCPFWHSFRFTQCGSFARPQRFGSETSSSSPPMLAPSNLGSGRSLGVQHGREGCNPRGLQGGVMCAEGMVCGAITHFTFLEIIIFGM